MAVAFSNIFMARIEKQILTQSCMKQLFWKRYIDDVFSLWNTSLNKIESFAEKANNFHSTIKFTPLDVRNRDQVLRHKSVQRG